MPLTELDTILALIVIDLQKGIVSLPTAHPVSRIISRSARLAAAPTPDLASLRFRLIGQSLFLIFPRLGETTNTADVLKLF